MDDASTKKMTVITCEPTVDITVVEQLFGYLKKALAERHEVQIEAEQVQRIDGAVLQLFTAFMRDARSSDLAVTWKSKSDALVQAAELLGLTRELGLE